jgi:hypothetical protein
MTWFAIEIGVALAPLALLVWWTVRSMRRQRAQHEQARQDEADLR